MRRNKARSLKRPKLMKNWSWRRPANHHERRWNATVFLFICLKVAGLLYDRICCVTRCGSDDNSSIYSFAMPDAC